MADQTIDKLQVEVTATAKGTNAIFNQLEAQMRTLKRALDAIDVSKLTTLNKATASVKPKVDTSGLTKAETDAKNSVNKIQQALAGLVAYADKAKLGDSSMMTSFERKATSVQSAIDALDAKFKQMGEIKLPTEAFSKVQAEMEKTESHLESLKRQQQEMKDSGYNPAVSQSDKWDDLVAKLKLAEEEFIRLKAIQDGLVNSGNAFTYPLDAYKEALGSTRAQLEQLVSATRAAFDATQQKPDNSGLDDTKNKAEEATAALRKMFQQATSKLSDKLKSSLKKIASSLASIKDAASKAADKGFMKLLKYGFGIRSIYVLFRRLRKAVVDSFGDLQKSGAFFETTKQNVTDLKTALVTLKFQFGAAFEPIFNAVAPALKVFIENLITAMNALSAFTAKLMGKSTYSKVQMVTLATEKAAKNAKELNKQLQKFDELNNLTTNKGSGSGSSDNSDHAVYTTENVENALGEFGQKLADLMRAGDWNGVGTAISEKLAEQLNSINWTSIKGKAAKFGKNLADFLNGLIKPETFRAIGTTIGEAINTGLTFFNEWGKGMDWENLGKSLAEGFNAWLKAGNLALLGETLHTWISGGLDALITLIDETDFEELGKQLAEFIANLNIPELATKLITLAKKILEALGEAIKSLWSNSDITGKITMAIVGLLLTLNFVGKLGGLATLIISALGGSFGTGGITGAIGTMLGSSLSGQTISVAANGLKIKLAGAGLVLSGAAIVGGTALASSMEHNPLDFNKETGLADWSKLLIGTGLTSTGIAGLAKVFGGSFSSAFPKALGIVGAQYGGSVMGNKIGKDWWDMMGRGDIASAYDEWLGFGIDPIKTFKGYADIFEGIKTGNFVDAWNNMWGDIGEWFYDTHQENRKKLKEWASELWSDYLGGDVTKALEDSPTNIAKAWGNVNEQINKASSSYNNLGIVTSSVGSKLVEIAQKSGKIGDEGSKGANRFTQTLNKLPSTVETIFNKAYEGGTKKWSGLGTWANDLFSQVDKASESKLRNVPNNFNKNFEEGTSQARSKVSSFSTWFQSVNLEKKAGIKADEPSFNRVKSTYENFVRNFKDHTATIKVDGQGFEAIGSKISSLVSQLRTAQSLKSNLSNSYYSSGYSNLRYFASGGIVSGAMHAVVGEAGPEAILPLTDSTLGSLAHLIVGEMATPQMASVNSNISSYSGNSDAVAEQNALLKEEIQLLRQIANKDLTISSSEVFNATRSESNNYYNRTGNSPFLF